MRVRGVLPGGAGRRRRRRRRREVALLLLLLSLLMLLLPLLLLLVIHLLLVLLLLLLLIPRVLDRTRQPARATVFVFRGVAKAPPRVLMRIRVRRVVIRVVRRMMRDVRTRVRLAASPPQADDAWAGRVQRGNVVRLRLRVQVRERVPAPDEVWWSTDDTWNAERRVVRVVWVSVRVVDGGVRRGENGAFLSVALALCFALHICYVFYCHLCSSSSPSLDTRATMLPRVLVSSLPLSQ